MLAKRVCDLTIAPRRPVDGGVVKANTVPAAESEFSSSASTSG